MRKIKFINGEYYHIYNRGVDKRDVFSDNYDLPRFFQSMEEFNNLEPVGGIYANSHRDRVSKPKNDNKLVNFICYCINSNHYHFLLEQVNDNGIEKFMHRLGVGYTMFFNKKYDRSGALFQGEYKAIHVGTNEYLLHLSSYINLNDKVHRLRDSVSKSSREEYFSNVGKFCKKDIISGQFNSLVEYKKFAESSLKDILERKDMENMLLE